MIVGQEVTLYAWEFEWAPCVTGSTCGVVGAPAKFASGIDLFDDDFFSFLSGRKKIGRSDRTPIRYCTLFRDNSSRMMFAHMQSNTNAVQTLEGKSKFERFCRSQGVFVKKYRADNGVFASNTCVQDIKQNQQSISYSCTGVHFQNGVAARGIRVVTPWSIQY